jgi:hypothetical protein
MVRKVLAWLLGCLARDSELGVVLRTVVEGANDADGVDGLPVCNETMERFVLRC